MWILLYATNKFLLNYHFTNNSSKNGIIRGIIRVVFQGKYDSFPTLSKQEN